MSVTTQPYTATYGVVHDVLLNTAVGDITPQSLRMLLAVAEAGGTIEAPSHTLVVRLGANATAIRRSSLALADAGLVTNTSRRGVGMRLALTARGEALATAMRDSIRAGLATIDEAIAA